MPIQKLATAAILYELNQPLRVEEILLPELLPGQVLVKIFYSGVCRSQVMECKGGRGPDPWLPHMLGHEGSGQVVAVGDGVTKVVPGDDVILGWVKGFGLDAPGAIYTSNGVKINSGRVTTFSNYSIVSESRVYRKPKGLAPTTAVLFGCALPTGAGMVFNELKPKSTDTVAVLGLGGIGIAALLALSALDVHKIIAMDISMEKLRLAEKLGATHVIDPSSQDAATILKGIVPEGVDACIECAGSVSTIELGFKLVRKGGGHLLFASHPPEGEMIRLAPHELISGKRISGSWGGGSLPDQDISKMYDVLSRTGNALEILLKDVYPLNQINEALDDLAKGRTFRPLIQMPH
jgi:S-(hydroxymethyl)glutathione dehydrogenase / alcohol dehydrogenase